MMDWNNYKLEMVENEQSSKSYEMRFYVNGILRYVKYDIPESWVKERENALVFIGSEHASFGSEHAPSIMARSGNGAEYRKRILIVTIIVQFVKSSHISM